MPTRLRASSRGFLLALLALLAAALTLGAASAKTLYVATNGNDSSGDGTSAKPFRTIQRGVDAMVGGDVLVVRDGTYNVGNSSGGQVYVDRKGGTASRKTVIKAANRWKAKIRSASPFGGIEVRYSDHIVIEGFDIGPQNPSDGGNKGTGIEAWYSNHVTIRDNFAHDFGCNGISFRYADYALIERNVVRDNAKRSNFNCSGISVYQPRELNQNAGFHIRIRRNVAFENECTLPFNVGAGTSSEPTDGNGIILDDFYNTQPTDGQERAYKQDVLVENNLVFNNGGAGVKIYRTDKATVRHNTLYHNLRVLSQNNNYRPGEISIEDCPGIFTLANNIAVQRNTWRAKALFYVVYNQADFNVGFGWLGRWSNLFAGDYVLPTVADKTGAYNEIKLARGDGGDVLFADARTNVAGFGGIGAFDRYFRLQNSSPGNNSGDNGRRASVDLENKSRPQNGTVERGCYETTVADVSGGGGGGTTASNIYAYRDNYADGWRNWSYGGTVTARDAGIKKNGTHALKFTSSESWGALSLQRATARSGSGLASIRFWYRKWDDNYDYTARFRVRTDNNNGLTWKSFSPTNSWQEANFSAGALGSPAQVRRMDFNVPKNQTLWVDDVRLVYNTSNLNTVELEADVAAASAGQAALTVMPTVNTGAFTVELDVPERLAEVDMTVVGTDGRQVDAATLPVLPGRNRMHFDLTGEHLAEGVYLLSFRSADGTFQRAERVVIRR